MAIYLVQHGVSLSRDVSPDPGLSEKGRKDVQLIAGVAASYNVLPDRIIHSGKQRAEETAEIFHKTLKVNSKISQTDGIKPLDDVISFAQSINVNENLMIVSHLPFLEGLTAFMTTGNADVTVFKFQNGGIVCLDHLPPPSGWVIKWTLMPNIS